MAARPVAAAARPEGLDRRGRRRSHGRRRRRCSGLLLVRRRGLGRRRDVVVGARRRRAPVAPGRPRMPDGLGERLREVAHRSRPDRLVHEELPDRGGERPARDRDPVHVLHRDLRLRIADPDRGRERRRDPVEPRVRVILGRARLTACGPADVRADAGPGLDVLLEDLRHLGRDPVGNHAVAFRPAPVPVLTAVRRRRPW